MTFTSHERTVDYVAETRAPRVSELDTPRAPWRKVVSIVKLRVGYALFLECPGHIAFADARDARVNDGAGPKKMRCRACAGLAHRELCRSRPRPEDITACLRGEGVERPVVTRAINKLAGIFIERVRRHGPSAVRRAVAEACGGAAKSAGARRGLGPKGPVELVGLEPMTTPARARGANRRGV